MNYLQNNQSSGVPKYVWIAITALIGYLIISNMLEKIEEKRITMKYEAMTDEFLKQSQKDINTLNKTLEKSLNTFQDIPKFEIPKPTQNEQVIINKTYTQQTQNEQKNSQQNTQKSNIKIEMH